MSILRGDPCSAHLLRRFPATVELAFGAISVAILLGIPAGIVSAVWRNSFFDGCSRILALTGVSMPIFWLGLMLAGSSASCWVGSRPVFGSGQMLP